MEKQSAINLIRETFQNTFDKGRFSKFIKELLNHIEETPTTVYRGNIIPDAYKPYINTLDRIGKYGDVDENKIDILIIHLKKETSLERARTMQRNFIAWYLNGSRGGILKDAALVAFVSPDQEDWRFSLVKMDYRLDTSGKRIKTKKELTPARRFSFLVGTNENSHTAQSRLVPILEDDGHNPTLEELEEAFSIEKVTKEFFEKYRELFLWTKETIDEVVRKDSKVKADFNAKGVNTVDFAKKLLGQIVFLYFLQKKGWFGVERDSEWGTGSKQFLRKLFKGIHGKYSNFFNDILEPLFYDALSRDRSDIDHWNDQFKCKIPFLNGGLFDPIGNYSWYNTDILLPNELFSNQNKTKEGDIGNGILDIFDRYNFTVKEDEPLEKEVAVDPEMLGKAYEKFNAIRTDNYEEYKNALKSGNKGEENKFNKQYGVYYTPREIVHYMCQQSLINYLYTVTQASSLKEKERKQDACVTIAKEDIEALIHLGEQVSENEATALLKEKLIAEGKQKTTKNKPVLPESIKFNAALIDNKLAEITVCDPAVGSGAFLVGMMSEIVKARNVLSVFVTPASSLRNHKQDACDTYNFKRRCIERSLYGVDIDPGAVEIAKLRLWLSLVVDEDDIKNIKPLPNLDYKVVCGNSLLGVEKNLFNLNSFNELEKLKPLFFNETNPTKKQEYRAKIDDLISRITNGHREFDFEIYFSEVFHKKSGFDVVIANPPYVGIEDIKWDARRFYETIFKTATGRFDLYALFIEKAMQIKSTSGAFAFIIPGKFLNNKQFMIARKILCENHGVNVVKIDKKVFEAAQVDSVIVESHFPSGLINPKYKTYRYDGEQFKFLSEIDINKILDDKYAIFRLEIDTQADALISKIKRDTFKIKEIGEVKDGIVAGCIKDILFINKRINKDCKKLYFGKHLSRFHLRDTDIWVNYKPKEMLEEEIKRKGKKRPGLWMRDSKIFKREKILSRFVAKEIIATYDNESRFYEHTLHSTHITDKRFKTKYILGLFNSRLFKYYYQITNSQGGNIFPQVRISSIENLPIKLVSKKAQENIESLVGRILAITKGEDYLKDPKKQTKALILEAEIDQLVYNLYDLTPEEIKIVEGTNKS
ncbi:MAG: type IIS restriction/modification enzyme - site-specific DNA methyltransferase (adenine specific) [Candidatus Scalindua rubra]|uniref:site-specific DNA-methyltransferase (adenine-specific) n=1 Tax=Candidatus Scalindua rubra TaxID=1872076 RepID=A0A1E3XF67_9BACT|nr:MAG: type IIS restriction/modification enzyme - site-specific DNA methyltransferase (adenine specific) [Candidatus Scalindua rubra]